MRRLALPSLRGEAWILPDAATLSRTAADEIARLLSRAVRERGRATLALAGGSTPKATYAELAAGHRDGTRPVPWGEVHVFFGDERMVPLDHADSNHRMAQESLLRHVPVPPGQIHAVPTHLDPAAAARAYQDDLSRACAVEGGVPRLDVVLLGMGADGHTASLFPGTTALEEQTAWVAANWVPRLEAHRVTLTFPVLRSAREVLFLVTGSDKARVVREAVRPREGDPVHPAGQVRPSAGRVCWLLDEAAAAGLA